MRHLHIPADDGVERPERRNQLARGEHLDLQSSPAHVVAELGEVEGCSVERGKTGGPGRDHLPLKLGLRDDVRSVDRGRRRTGGGQHAAGLHQEPASLHEVLPSE